MRAETTEYNANSIQVLEGLEAVRVRPGMYVGGTDKAGMHHLIWEIVDNSVDEANAGHASKISIIMEGNTITVRDNGRGVPCDTHPKLGISTLDVVFTKLHAGGKFDNGAYKTAGGLHGVGAAVTNALSSSMEVVVHRDGNEYTRNYERGVPVGDLSTKKLKRNRTGTKVTFTPDTQIFGTKLVYDYATIRDRVKTKAYLNPGLTIELTDGEQTESFKFDNGLLDYLTELLDDSKDEVVGSPIHFKDNNLEVAIAWTDSTAESVVSFANGIYTRDGGTHVKGVDKAIVDTVRNMATELELWPKRMKVIPSDVREGMFIIVSTFISNPQFQGQTKDRLNNVEVEKDSFESTRANLTTALKDDALLKTIAKRIESSVRARVASRDAADAVKRSSPTSKVRLPGKLADCTSEDISTSELFIVEGDSAGGSAKQGRDRKTQAILPLRGKVLNSESAPLTKVLANVELSDLVTAIGTGVLERFDMKKLRYGKIIIMTDADSDGHHIATLLLTFFYRYMPELIEAGRVYLAQPPLYKIVHNKTTYWAVTEEHKDLILRKIKTADITRFKGLGEMPPKVLYETTMDPISRELLRVSIDDIDETEFWISSLMGKDADIRNELITLYSRDYAESTV